MDNAQDQIFASGTNSDYLAIFRIGEAVRRICEKCSPPKRLVVDSVESHNIDCRCPQCGAHLIFKEDVFS